MTDTIRTAGQIRQQLKQVLFRHLQKLLKAQTFPQNPPDTCHYRRQENLGGYRDEGWCLPMGWT